MSRVYTILHILPGPIYNPKAALEKKYVALSAFSKGAVVSLSDKDFSQEFGSYSTTCFGVGHKFGLMANLQLFFSAWRQARMLKKSGGLDFVVCYDPLKTGMIGFLIKMFFSCQLVIETNGVYDSPVLYQWSRGMKIKVKKVVYPLLQRFILCRADAIKSLYHDQLKSFVLPSRIIQVSFFDYTDIEPCSYSDSGQMSILSVGFPMYVKGHDLLVAAFKILRNDFPDWSLKIVGNYIQADVDKLKGLSGGDQAIQILPPVGFSEVSSLMDQCSIFVLPSRTEGMGRVLLEAMARNKVRLGRRVDGIPHVINDGVDGLLFKSEDIDDMATKLRYLMMNKSERIRMAEEGRARYDREFTLESYITNMHSFLNRLVH